jgi:hypothetical protein
VSQAKEATARSDSFVSHAIDCVVITVLSIMVMYAGRIVMKLIDKNHVFVVLFRALLEERAAKGGILINKVSTSKRSVFALFHEKGINLRCMHY